MFLKEDKIYILGFLFAISDDIFVTHRNKPPTQKMTSSKLATAKFSVKTEREIGYSTI